MVVNNSVLEESLMRGASNLSDGTVQAAVKELLREKDKKLIDDSKNLSVIMKKNNKLACGLKVLNEADSKNIIER